MKKKVVCGLILFIMTFISFSTVSKVLALNGYYADTYKKGDQFKLVKNAYKYNKIDEAFNNNFEKEDSEEYFCKKGETVTYEGEYGSDGLWNISYYMKVKRSDGQIGYINCANIEPIEGETSRPATLDKFISKYSVNNYIKNKVSFDKFLTEITTEYKHDALNDNWFNEAKNFYYNNRVRGTDTNTNSIGLNLEQRMNSCEYEYNDILKIPASGSKDEVFMVRAYIYAYTYCELADAMNVKGEVEEEIKELEKEKGGALGFEDYYNSWENATDTSKKAEWATKAIDAYQAMDEAQQEEHSEQFGNLIDETAEEEGELVEDIEEAAEDAVDDGNMTLYKLPTLADKEKDDVSSTIDDVIEDGKKLLNHSSHVDPADISTFSQSLNSIFVTIGIVIAVIVGVILGLQFMFSSVEGKAEVKKMLIAYMIGCVVVFASFAIWKVVIDILGNM